MKLAVTDACIFIDLIELQLSSEFFGLPIEIHTSLDVYNELYTEQKEFLKAYQSVGKLSIHNLSEKEREQIQEDKFPRSLSDNDKTVIFLAEKLNAKVISSDKAVRNYAKSKAIEFHGMLWIFDRLIEFKLISSQQVDLLKHLNWDVEEKKGTISYWLRQKEDTPYIEFVKGVMEVFPEINPYWLITGEGEKLISDQIKLILILTIIKNTH